MKSLIKIIEDTYGTKNRKDVQNWVGTQFARTGKIENQSVSLRDVDIELIIKEIETVIDTFNLSLETLLTGIQVLPGLNSDKSELKPIVFVNALAFKRYFERAGLIVKDLMIARKGDKVLYTGSNQHIEFEVNDESAKNKVMCGFINFLVPGDDSENDHIGSIIIEREELQACRSTMIKNVFGGVDMFRPQEWVAHGFCLLMKRIMSDASCVGVMKRLDKTELDKIKSLIGLSEIYYGNGQSKGPYEDLVYKNSYGKVIGRMVQRFGVVDKLKQKTKTSNVVVLRKPSLDEAKLGIKTGENAGPRPRTLAEKEVATGFGQF